MWATPKLVHDCFRCKRVWPSKAQLFLHQIRQARPPAMVCLFPHASMIQSHGAEIRINKKVHHPTKLRLINASSNRYGWRNTGVHWTLFLGQELIYSFISLFKGSQRHCIPFLELWRTKNKVSQELWHTDLQCGLMTFQTPKFSLLLYSGYFQLSVC